jgi:hypothetical protein
MIHGSRDRSSGSGDNYSRNRRSEEAPLPFYIIRSAQIEPTTQAPEFGLEWQLTALVAEARPKA